MDEGFLRVLALLRVAFGMHLLWVISSLGGRAWFLAGLPGSVRIPLGLAGLLPDVVPLAFAHVLFLIALAGILLLILGVVTPVASGVTFAAIVVLGSLIHSFGKIDHGHHLLILLLFVLGSSPWGARWSLDAWMRRRRGLLPTGPVSFWPEWPLKVAMLLVGMLYATSGALKLYVGGFLAPGTMSDYLAGRTVLMERVGRPLVEPWASISSFLITHPGLADLLSWSTVALELGIVLGVLTRRLGVAALGMVAVLHTSIMLLSGLVFVHNVIVALVLAAAFIILIARDRGGRIGRWFPARTRQTDTTGVRMHNIFIASVAVATLVLVIAAWAPLWNWSVPADPWGRALLLDLLPGLRNNAVHTAGLVIGLAFAGWAIGSLLASAYRVVLREPAASSPLVLLFDQDCGFCRRWVEWAKERRPVAVTFGPCQQRTHLLQENDLEEKRCIERAYLLPAHRSSTMRPGSDPQGGASAILGVLRRFPGHRNAAWRIIGSTRNMTGIHAVAEWSYCIVAKNRHRLGKGPQGCAVK